MSSPSDLRYRIDHSGIDRDTSLLLPASAYELAVGCEEFRQHTGLPGRDIVSVPVTAAPLPRYPDQRETDHRPRWSQVAPGAMWHPGFWLPEQVWPRQVRDEMVEPDEIWSTRICLQLSAAGLWESAAGWVDVPFVHGIDTSDVDDAARIMAWQAGGHDEGLDQIDLTDRFDPEDQDWALETATRLYEPLRQAMWAVTADEILAYVIEAESGAPVEARAKLITDLGITALYDAAPPRMPAGAEFWPGLEEEITDCGGDPAQLLAGPLEHVLGWAAATRDHYRQAMDQLDGLESMLTPPSWQQQEEEPVS